METLKQDLRPYGIDPSKGRSYENITYVLALVYNTLRARVEKYLAAQNLCAVQFNLLMLAAYQNNGQGLSQVDLSKRLIASASNITKLVEKSVQAGWLTRKTNPQNRRANIICITEQGQKLIDSIWPGYDALLRSLTACIPAQEQAAMAQILDKWFFNLQQENK
ncbi:MAG: MarR family transcriptional regulator [Elusimicrobiaceae bacterium]|nr:MarR family transcriptional regulator [Elusimicrobiaceae bacterium]